MWWGKKPKSLIPENICMQKQKIIFIIQQKQMFTAI